MASEIAAIERMFAEVGCAGTLHVVDLANGVDIAIDADAPVVMASVFKAIVALEFYDRVVLGTCDGARRVDVVAPTPGPTGLSIFRDGATLSLRDLCRLMLSISDNAATDILMRTVGVEAVNARAAAAGCRATHVTGDLQTMLDGVGRDLGFDSYAQLLEAQSGRLGENARLNASDAGRVARLGALDPARASVTTARDMTAFLRAVWMKGAAAPEACADLVQAMRAQVTRRLESAVPAGGWLAAKSGGLFGVIRNEIALIGHPDGRTYAAAIFTRAQKPFENAAAINVAMGRIVDFSIRVLR